MSRGRICLLGASIDDPYDSSLVVARTSETTHCCDHGGHTGLSIPSPRITLPLWAV